jgi:hypothetical protein
MDFVCIIRSQNKNEGTEGRSFFNLSFHEACTVIQTDLAKNERLEAGVRPRGGEAWWDFSTERRRGFSRRNKHRRLGED